MENNPVLKWQPVEEGWAPNDNCVEGGQDVNGDMTFVGRAFLEGDIIPGKIVPSHKVCYVSRNGKEHGCDQYQVLEVLGDARVVWFPSSNGEVPPGAVKGGSTAADEPLFIGRAQHEGATVVGKIHPDHKVLYIPFGGEEESYEEYETLCVKCITF